MNMESHPFSLQTWFSHLWGGDAFRTFFLGSPTVPGPSACPQHRGSCTVCMHGKCRYGAFQSMRVPPNHPFYSQIFHWKPSSYWGTKTPWSQNWWADRQHWPQDHPRSLGLYTKLVGGLEHFLFFHKYILGISSSQLTNSIIFQRGRSATNQIYIHKSIEWVCMKYRLIYIFSISIYIYTYTFFFDILCSNPAKVVEVSCAGLPVHSSAGGWRAFRWPCGITLHLGWRRWDAMVTIHGLWMMFFMTTGWLMGWFMDVYNIL